MNINTNSGLTPYQMTSAQKVVKEFADVEAKMMAVDNTDKVDLDSSAGNVKVDFTPLTPGAKEKFSGELSFDPSTKETKNLFVTKNYDKPGGVGVNYVKRDLDAENVYLRKDDMYQEYPMYRQIDEVVVNKTTGEIKSFESYEERDGMMPIGGFGPGGDFGGFFVAGH